MVKERREGRRWEGEGRTRLWSLRRLVAVVPLGARRTLRDAMASLSVCLAVRRVCRRWSYSAFAVLSGTASMLYSAADDMPATLKLWNMGSAAHSDR